VEDERKLQVPQALKERFEEAGKHQGWLHDTAPLLLAVSGGSDSVALVLLAFLLLPRERLILAHLEHGIRGEASLGDARFVASLAADLQLPLECRHVITQEERHPHESLESTARRLRYSFLEELSGKYGKAWIATGHTKNDVQETVLFNLFRGTGIRGLGGVPSRRGRIVRPLLGCARQELRDFLKQNGFSWKEDATNEDLSYARNYIRQILLPQIEEHINARAGEHLADLASDVRILRERDEEIYGDMLSRLRREMPMALSSWDLSLARNLSSWDLRMALMEQARRLDLSPLSRSRMIKLEKLLRTSGRWRFQWKGGVDLCCGAGMLSWILPEKQLLIEPGEIFLDDLSLSRKSGSWIITAEEQPGFSPSPESLDMPDMLHSPSPIFTASEEYEALLPLPSSGEGRICSLEHWLSMGDAAQTAPFRKILPWWVHPLWPVILWGAQDAWIPGAGRSFSKYPDAPSFSEENHVTIARLLCSLSENSLRKNEKSLRTKGM
jgi:tRNA(Ile)-lysidine synthase